MSGCDICGKNLELFRVKIEGSLINACKNCSRFGNVLSSVWFTENHEKIKSKKISDSEDENVELPVENLGNIIKNERKKMNLNQKELALKLNEKESVIQKIENNEIIPDMKLIDKLEKFFHAKLTAKNEAEEVKIQSEETMAFTLGDFMKKGK
ncbi:TIGR00270 family protein [Candidatus Woesearchaeota archaeon]|nr:TIGR00270 family protein [Candidatus Woesearchaeota archaeon]